MDEGDLEGLRAAASSAFAERFGAVLKIIVGDGAVLSVDGNKAPPAVAVAKETSLADCCWRLSADAFEKILCGEVDPANAFLSGRLRVTGDISVMARLTLADANKEAAGA